LPAHSAFKPPIPHVPARAVYLTDRRKQGAARAQVRNVVQFGAGGILWQRAGRQRQREQFGVMTSSAFLRFLNFLMCIPMSR
jgi:hypothetical protein